MALFHVPCHSLGDLIHRNMIPMIAKKQALAAAFSAEGKEELMIYHEKVCEQLYLLKESFAERNPEKAKEIMAGAQVPGSGIPVPDQAPRTAAPPAQRVRRNPCGSPGADGSDEAMHRLQLQHCQNLSFNRRTMPTGRFLTI